MPNKLGPNPEKRKTTSILVSYSPKENTRMCKGRPAGMRAVSIQRRTSKMFNIRRLEDPRAQSSCGDRKTFSSIKDANRNRLKTLGHESSCGHRKISIMKAKAWHSCELQKGTQVTTIS